MWSLIAAILAPILNRTRVPTRSGQTRGFVAALRNERSPQLSALGFADAIGKAVTADRLKTRSALGFAAKPLIAGRGLLPDRQHAH